MSLFAARSGLAFIFWIYVGGLSPASAYDGSVGGAESMDRPSARILHDPARKPEPAPQGFGIPDHHSPEPAGAPPSVGSQRFFISRIEIQGNTVLPENELAELLRPYAGRLVSVAELENVRQQLTHRLIERGYVNSGAIIADDKPDRNGILPVKIIEGRLSDVQVKGQGRLREGYIRNRLLGDPEQPLNLHDLQDRFQLLLADNTLIKNMKGRLLPGETPGQSVLAVEVKPVAHPYRLSVFADNQRPPSIGGEAFGTHAELRNLLTLGDTLDFTFITGSGSDRYAGGVILPFNDWGSEAFFRFDESESVLIEKAVRSLNIESRVHSLEGGVSHPFINTPRQKLKLGVLLALRENETSILGQSFSFIPGQSSGHSQATVWRLFQDYAQRWQNHAFAFRSTFSAGMNALGATPENKGQFPDSEFLAWLGQAQYAYKLTDAGALLALHGTAQFSNEPLLPLERIAIGGLQTVRGYRENQLVRDEGYSISLELRYPVFGQDDFHGQRLALVPFMDYGQAWNKNGETSTLHSAGIGFNWEYQLGRRALAADLYYGYAINKPRPQFNNDIQDDGLHFRVSLD
ncbi:MAG: ShlB/FhaC/HecB family hemolysin secretion/activation protein, partial [Methylococcales bacterium]